MKRLIVLLLSMVLIAVICTGCAQAPSVFEQLKTENGMAVLIDEVQSGRAQYLGYQEVTIKGEADFRDMYNNFYNAEEYVKAARQQKPCLPDEKLKGIPAQLVNLKTISPVQQKINTPFDLLYAKGLERGTYSRFDFVSKINDTRTVYFTFFISNDETVIRAYGYAVTCQDFLGTLALNEYYYLIESPSPSPLQINWD